MRNTFDKKAGLAVFCALALSVLSTTALAQATDEKALVTDTQGKPVINASGECWHNGFGPMPQWTRGCHAAVPAPVALYVAPAAAPAAAPVPVVWETVAFDANVMFDSDKSALRQSGRDTLDQFVAKIHGLDSQSIFAIGYADRMGTDASNQTLSQERVDAVRAYLVAQGIASNRLETSARGEMRPTTFPGECKDANNAKNVACMQPDRHVFIEVSGTRIAK